MDDWQDVTFDVSSNVSLDELSESCSATDAKRAHKAPPLGANGKHARGRPGRHLLQSDSVYLFQIRMPLDLAGGRCRTKRMSLGPLTAREARRTPPAYSNRSNSLHQHPRTSPATEARSWLFIPAMEAWGSTALTSTFSPTSRRITLQGNMAPTFGSTPAGRALSNSKCENHSARLSRTPPLARKCGQRPS